MDKCSLRVIGLNHSMIRPGPGALQQQFLQTTTSTANQKKKSHFFLFVKLGKIECWEERSNVIGCWPKTSASPDVVNVDVQNWRQQVWDLLSLLWFFSLRVIIIHFARFHLFHWLSFFIFVKKIPVPVSFSFLVSIK